MIEALLDPKTWLFALLAALNTVPYSTGNQYALIISSFGFTYLQTTLLGCVGGVVLIVSIWTGVKLAACFPNSTAYVAARLLLCSKHPCRLFTQPLTLA